MGTLPGSQKVSRGDVVRLNPYTGAVQQVIPLQYNPVTVTWTYRFGK